VARHPLPSHLLHAALAVLPLLPMAAARAQSALNLPLECQLKQGPWQPCTLTIEQMGAHWWLQIGEQRLVFHSDGRGSVTLSDPTGVSRTVQPVWTAQRELCWDGVCTKGDFPLD
jgi:hypothetical protein